MAQGGKRVTTQRGFGSPDGRESAEHDEPARPGKRASRPKPRADEAHTTVQSRTPSKAQSKVGSHAKAPSDPAALSGAACTSAGAGAPVDVEVIAERGAPGLLAGPWRALEIWTRNRVYALDARMTCITVIDRQSDRPQDEHPVLGATLVGGQLRGAGGAIEQVAHPYPRIGMTAVFTKKMGTRMSYSETSSVTRVLLRLRLVEVGTDAATPDWDDIVGG